MIVFDTNILCTFAKIDKLKLIVDLFKGVELLIPQSVIDEVVSSKQNYVNNIIENDIFKQIKITEQEKAFEQQLKENLGKGEKECISICANRGLIFVTNDEKAIKEAEKYSIEWLNLEIILCSLKEEKIVSRDELKNIIEEIEIKDKVKIPNKEELLR